MTMAFDAGSALLESFRFGEKVNFKMTTAGGTPRAISMQVTSRMSFVSICYCRFILCARALELELRAECGLHLTIFRCFNIVQRS